MKASHLACSLATVVLMSGVSLTQTQTTSQYPICGDPVLRWQVTKSKSHDSSINTTVYFPVDAATLAHAVIGLQEYVSAFDTEAEYAIDSLCFTIDTQQMQISQMQDDITELKKQVAALKKPQSPKK
jgi:hypothetical protein